MHAILHHALTNAGLAAAAAIAAVLLSGMRLAPSWRYGLWLIVLARLVMPPILRWEAPAWVEKSPSEPSERQPLSKDAVARERPVAVARETRESIEPQNVMADDDLRNASPASAAAPFDIEDFPVASHESEVLANDSSLQPVKKASAPMRETGRLHEQGLGASGLPWRAMVADSWREFAIAIWVAGAAAWFALAARRIRAFHRLVQTAAPAPREVLDLASDCATRIGLVRSPEVRMTEGRLSPLVWGVASRPFVLLPTRLWAELGPGQQATLLAHEFAHVRRRDHWMRWGELAVLGLFWWYPLAWWVRNRLQRAEEECCDARVLAAFPGQGRDYGQALMATIDFLAADRNESPALASSFGREHTVKRRLQMILRNELAEPLGKGAWAGLLAFGLLVLAVTVYTTQAQEESTAKGGKTAVAEPESEDAEDAESDEEVGQEVESVHPEQSPGNKDKPSVKAGGMKAQAGRGSKASVEERLDRLERNLNRLLERMERGETAGGGMGGGMRASPSVRGGAGGMGGGMRASPPKSGGAVGMGAARRSEDNPLLKPIGRQIRLVFEQFGDAEDSDSDSQEISLSIEQIQAIREYSNSLDGIVEQIANEQQRILKLLEADRARRERELKEINSGKQITSRRPHSKSGHDESDEEK